MSAPKITPMISIEHVDFVCGGRRAQLPYCAAEIVVGAMRFRLLRPTVRATAWFGR
jgi:hypothetical protein